MRREFSTVSCLYKRYLPQVTQLALRNFRPCSAIHRTGESRNLSGVQAALRTVVRNKRKEMRWERWADCPHWLTCPAGSRGKSTRRSAYLRDRCRGSSTSRFERSGSGSDSLLCHPGQAEFKRIAGLWLDNFVFY